MTPNYKTTKNTMNYPNFKLKQNIWQKSGNRVRKQCNRGNKPGFWNRLASFPCTGFTRKSTQMPMGRKKGPLNPIEH
ncbi:Uncharacterized protein APZ42_025149 [Daphnia magna]|uniref:Uncharacterized protein n=1 Tax=Daphnia magna TaxID=35525 RepID=A0A164TEB5_9CRUS|nr:Uncharacterized protein APZ42_025149 [Daphnia magna]